jgi:hypothetical protein
MSVLRGLAAALLFAVTSLWAATGLWATGLWAASPASADPTAGFFAYQEEGLPPVTWSLSPTCLPPSFCYLHVTSSTAAQNTVAERAQNFGAIAQLSQGTWTLVVNKPVAIECGDGTTAATTDTYRFDQAQTGGTHTISHKGVCGLPPATITKPFGLRFEAPPPYPIDNYPLYCTDIRFWCPY